VGPPARSSSRLRTPRRDSSSDSVSPVGPAPTITTGQRAALAAASGSAALEAARAVHAHCTQALPPWLLTASIRAARPAVRGPGSLAAVRPIPAARDRRGLGCARACTCGVFARQGLARS